MTGRYPELAALAAAVGAAGVPMVVDGEIVAFDAAGRPSFSRLQRRMQIAHPPAALVAAVPAVYLIFDVLQLAGESLLERSYAERRTSLDGLAWEGPVWRTPPAWFGGGADVLTATQERGPEGVVAERLTSRYLPGSRGRDWIKVGVGEDSYSGWLAEPLDRTGDHQPAP